LKTTCVCTKAHLHLKMTHTHTHVCAHKGNSNENKCFAVTHFQVTNCFFLILCWHFATHASARNGTSTHKHSYIWNHSSEMVVHVETY